MHSRRKTLSRLLKDDGHPLGVILIGLLFSAGQVYGGRQIHTRNKVREALE